MTMAFLQGKTPISFLQELCTKRGITPQYDLIANEGAVHEPTFVFKVTAGEDFMGTGKGASKKKAKHNAAMSILNQMMGGVDGQGLVVDGQEPESTPSASGDDAAGNPVGELQEMTQKRLWPPPIYDYTSEQGPPHAREFICNVRLLNLQERGVGKSKKIAKRNGAQAMIQLLKQGTTQPELEPETLKQEYDPDNMPLPNSELISTYSALKSSKLPTLTPQASQQINQFYQDLKAQSTRSQEMLQKQVLNMDSLNYVQMLQDIAKEQKFEVTYVPIQEPTLSETHMCIIELTYKKRKYPVVCQGIGQNEESCRDNAAANALLYLASMTKCSKASQK